MSRGFSISALTMELMSRRCPRDPAKFFPNTKIKTASALIIKSDLSLHKVQAPFSSSREVTAAASNSSIAVAHNPASTAACACKRVLVTEVQFELPWVPWQVKILLIIERSC